MNKIEVLCNNEREMLMKFSSLCLGRLNGHRPVKLLLSLFRRFLDANVLKEIDKDRLVIEYAAAEYEKGKDRSGMDLNGLFEKTKEIDNDFVKNLDNPLISLKIRHEDFAEIRKKRIAAIAGMVFDLLENWRDDMAFHAVVKNAFTEESYRGYLDNILHLYNVETRILSNSLSLRGPAGKVKDLFAEKLYDIMEETAADIALAYSRKIYHDKV